MTDQGYIFSCNCRHSQRKLLILIRQHIAEKRARNMKATNKFEMEDNIVKAIVLTDNGLHDEEQQEPQELRRQLLGAVEGPNLV